MKEHLTVDSVMTADGEVVPLGPVDKEGHRVPLDTTSLYGPRGEHYKAKSFELDTSVELDVSVNGSCGETVGADVTADAYIEDIKYCPFCGEEL